MKRIIQVIVAVLAVAYVVVSFTEIENIATSLSKGNWPFLLLAFCIEMICLVNNSVTYRAIFRLVGVTENLKQLFLLSTASTFVNIIAPTGGIGGVAFFIASARKRNIPSARVMVIGILYALYEYVSLLGVVALGFIALIRRNDLNAGELTAAGLLFLIAFSFGLLLFLANKSSDLLGRLLEKLSRWGNRMLYRFFHRDLFNPENARNFANELGEGISAIRGSKKNLLIPLLFSLLNKALLITVMACIFLALDTPFSTGTLVGAYSIGQLFYYISPTPGGVGVVEGILPVALNLLRVPFSKALLLTLMYRGVTFWFPFVVGGITMRLLQRQNGKS